jgi:hypothetical protein
MGVNMNQGSHAALTNIAAAGSNTTGGVGISIGKTAADSSASSVELDTATVTGGIGIDVNRGSSLTLNNRIEVTGVTKGINVTSGSVKNPASDRTADLAGLARTITVTGNDARAMEVEEGSVDLNGYTFNAQITNGIGVYTGNGTVTMTLSDINNPGTSGGASVWGYNTGVVAGKNTDMTLSDYLVYGAVFGVGAKEPVNVAGGTAGAMVYGTLHLSGINTLLGGQYGIYSEGGTCVELQLR